MIEEEEETLNVHVDEELSVSSIALYILFISSRAVWSRVLVFFVLTTTTASVKINTYAPTKNTTITASTIIGAVQLHICTSITGAINTKKT